MYFAFCLDLGPLRLVVAVTSANATASLIVFVFLFVCVCIGCLAGLNLMFFVFKDLSHVFFGLDLINLINLVKAYCAAIFQLIVIYSMCFMKLIVVVCTVLYIREKVERKDY